jgi:hypothetical protein
MDGLPGQGKGPLLVALAGLHNSMPLPVDRVVILELANVLDRITIRKGQLWSTFGLKSAIYWFSIPLFFCILPVSDFPARVTNGQSRFAQSISGLF